MTNTYQIYLVSDSTGETLDRVFLAIKAQFKNIDYEIKSYFFTRTENQINKILEEAKKQKNSIILYTIVDSNLAKFLANKSAEKKIPCFGVLGNLILSFSKLLNQQASHVLGVSRTSKTPTSIYLANKGFKTSNIPLVNKNSIPKILKEKPKLSCVIGLTSEPERLADIRKNRLNTLKEKESTNYTDIEKIKKEVDDAKKTFKKYGWPIIDVTRKSVEEAAASIIKIHEIYKGNE